jgi:hypothetical protein
MFPEDRLLGLELAGLRNNERSEASKPPVGLRVRRLEDLGYEPLVEVVRPAGLPRLLEVRLEVAPRVVLVYLRVLDFPLALVDRILAFSVISGIIAQRVSHPPRPALEREIR